MRATPTFMSSRPSSTSDSWYPPCLAREGRLGGAESQLSGCPGDSGSSGAASFPETIEFWERSAQRGSGREALAVGSAACFLLQFDQSPSRHRADRILRLRRRRGQGLARSPPQSSGDQFQGSEQLWRTQLRHGGADDFFERRDGISLGELAADDCRRQAFSRSDQPNTQPRCRWSGQSIERA